MSGKGMNKALCLDWRAVLKTQPANSFSQRRLKSEAIEGNRL
ncbi:MAG: hypothetical protein ACI9WR_001071 [Paracoccaceae bacterium]